jgi:YegS/Rv2252/BmrU family lipid kinase
MKVSFNEINIFHVLLPSLPQLLKPKKMNNPDKNEWLVLVNPNAGNGKGKKDWERISSAMKDGGLIFTEKFTEKKGHAIPLTLEGIESGYRKIVTVGGDGSLNEVVNGVFLNRYCPTRDITLAMIPVGTGNDWGRMFGIPADYIKAVKIIRDEKQILHDVGTVSYYDGPEKKNRYFINIAGLGFESVVVRRSNIQKEKGRSGKAVYFSNLLLSLLTYRNTKAEIDIDGIKIFADVFSISVGNGRYCGGGMRQTPDALPDDGILDVTIINGMGKIEIIRNLNMLFDGTILNHPKIDGYKCKNIKVSSESIIYAEADGETLGHTPLEFNIIPGSIKVVYGTKIIQ